MKKVTKVVSALFPAIFVLGLSLSAIPHYSVNEAGEDTAIYSNESSVTSLDKPDVRYNAEEEDPEEGDVTVEVDKVILHYYNEGGGNDDRAFYLWVTGVDGREYNTKFGDTYNPGYPDNPIMVVESPQMMTITIDFTTSEFADFAKRAGLYFIIKFALKSPTDLNWGGQSDDMYIRYADYPQAVKDKVCELWTMPAAGGGVAILDSYNKTQVHGVALAQFVDWKTIRCTLTKNTTTVNWKLYAYDQTYFKIKPRKREENQKHYLVKEGTGTGNFDIKFKYEAHINMVYSLESHDPSTDSDPDMAVLNKVVTVSLDYLYDSDKFHTYYENANLKAKLGAFYSPESTTFRVWSPVSSNIKTLIYEKDTSSEYCGSDDENVKKAYDKYDGYQMQYKTGGIWEVTIEGNLEGKYYNFQVDNSLGTNIVMDPYATSAGANGLRGLIYDKNSAKVTPNGWNDLPLKWDGQTAKGLDITTPQQLSIYEIHIQDLTGDESWGGPAEDRGTYKGFVTSGTTCNGQTTGYDHIKDLGVNAVQIMPTFDHDNNEVAATPKYNWGYNPLNYNVPEGAYSSNPHDGYARVKEFRNLVLQMSKQREGHADDVHTRTIMDVVYNHVSSATGSNFHKLMPRYYFRYVMNSGGYTYPDGWHIDQGELWDGSGCHNEVATERPMMRKFIVDSLCMWATDYKIKGFRFDLMGLIDFQTMIEAKKALYAIDPDIYMYGEGWSLGYHGEGSDPYNAHYGGTPHNFGTEKWQIYNECNNFRGGTPTTGEIYLGSFNDNYRNSMRGGNDGGGKDSRDVSLPGAGWIQSGNWPDGNFNVDTLHNIAVALKGCARDIYGNTGAYPEQTVNYVSCHDNWTLMDQLLQSLLSKGYPKDKIGEYIMRASIQAHAMTMQANSPAFILGGEEIFRTKKISDADLPLITDETSYAEMCGGRYSHNSYNSPLSVNSFKWENKTEFTVSGDFGGSFSQTVKNSQFNYVDAFKSLIRAHQNVEFKRGENTTDFHTITGDDADLWWCKNGEAHGEGEASNNIGFWINGTHILAFVGWTDDIDDYGNSCKDAWLNGTQKSTETAPVGSAIFEFGGFKTYDDDGFAWYKPKAMNAIFISKARS